MKESFESTSSAAYLSAFRLVAQTSEASGTVDLSIEDSIGDRLATWQLGPEDVDRLLRLLAVSKPLSRVRP